MIQIRDLELSFGHQKIFENVSCNINENQRVGLVGRNGSGKSTLLKIIAKQQSLDAGIITYSSNKQIAYLPQEMVLLSDKTILEEAFSTFADVFKIHERVKEIELELNNNIDHSPQIINEYAEINEKLKEFEIDKLFSETKKVLLGLGFSQTQMENKVNSLSVGWKMRLVLGKLLLQKADFYLFDEPTNHLDLFAKNWLVDFLKNSSFGFIIVSHEKYLLDQLCSNILELENTHSRLFTGNYSKYIKQKENERKLKEAAFIVQQKEIKQKERVIERFRASASKAKMAQSMIKALDRIERITLDTSPATMKLTFPETIQPGKIILNVENLSFSFGTNKLFEHVSFEVARGEKVALIAPNGRGKTTLFNVISGKYALQEGKITFGHNVKYTIFAQDQNESLNLNNIIIDEISNSCPKISTAQIRSFLGTFLFSGKDVEKKIRVLSGGEKNRVAMVRVLLQSANFLMLDEPTNHLDIESKDVLLKALQDYNGTILFVSHDHDFINELATKIVELTPEGIISYSGNYENYKYYKEQISKSDQADNSFKQIEKPTKKLEQKEIFNLRKLSKKLEEKITKLESIITEIQKTLENLDYNDNQFQTTLKKLQDAEIQHQAAFHEWEEIEKKLSE